MTKTLIVYFSQAGSTRKVAQAIADGLRSHDHHVDLHHLPDGPPPALDGCDTLGIGFPVYIWRPPIPVSDYLDALPHLDDLPYVPFAQSAGLEGGAAAMARRTLTAKGGREADVFTALGADHQLALLRRSRLLAADHPTADELVAANAFGVDVARRMAGAEYVKPAEERAPTPLVPHRAVRDEALALETPVQPGLRRSGGRVHRLWDLHRGVPAGDHHGGPQRPSRVGARLPRVRVLRSALSRRGRALTTALAPLHPLRRAG